MNTSKNKLDILTEYVMGNRSMLFDAFDHLVNDIKYSDSNRDKLSYISKVQVSPSDVASALSDLIPIEDLRAMSNGTYDETREDLKAKKEEYDASLNLLLDQIIAIGRELTTSQSNNSEAAESVASEYPSATSSIVNETETFPRNWAAVTGNVHAAHLHKKYKEVIQPHSPFADSFAFLSVPFKHPIWQQAGPSSTSKSIIAECKSARRSAIQDLHIIPASTSLAQKLVIQHPTVARYLRIPLRQFLRSISLFYQLSDVDFDLLETQSEIQTFEDGDTVLAFDEVTDYVMVLLSGTVTKRVVTTPINANSASIEYSFDLSIGDVFGVLFEDIDELSTSIEYVSSGVCHVLLLPLDALMDSLANSDGLNYSMLRRSPPFHISSSLPSAECARLHQFIEQSLDLFEAFEGNYVSPSALDGKLDKLRNMNHRRQIRRKSYKIQSELGSETATDLDSLNPSTALSAEDIEAKRSLIFTLLSLLSPGISMEGEGLEDILAIIEQFFSVNRVRYFEVNRDKHVMLMKALSLSLSSYTFTEYPIVGITGFVARNQCLLNISDVTTCELFDKRLDQVPGEPSKQLICVPTDCSLVASTNRVNGVLQLINSLTGQWVGEREEALLTIFGMLLGSTMQSRCSYLKEIQSIPTRSLDKIKFSFQLERIALKSNALITPKTAVKCVATLLLSATQSASKPITTAAVALSSTTTTSSSIVAAGILLASFDIAIEFSSVYVSQLPQCCKVLLEFFVGNSRKAAPSAIGWTLFPLFDAGGVLAAASRRFRIHPGPFTGSIFTPNSTELKIRRSNRSSLKMGSSASLAIHDQSSSSSAAGDDFGAAAAAAAGAELLRITSDCVDIWFPVFDGHPVLYSRKAAAASDGSEGSKAAALRSAKKDNLSLSYLNSAKDMNWYLNRMSKTEKIRFQQLLSCKLCSLRPMMLDASDRSLLWAMRHSLLSQAEYLPFMLLSIDWTDAEVIDEAYQLMSTWESPQIIQMLQLLSSSFSDITIRSFASQKLNDLENEEINILLPFLCKLLVNYESNADNALSRQLITRCLSSFDVLGMHLITCLLCELSASNQFIVLPLLEIIDRFCFASVRVAIGLQYQIMHQIDIALSEFEQVMASKPATSTIALSENRLQAVEAFQQSLESSRDFLPNVFSLPACNHNHKQFTRIHARMSGPVNDIRSNNFIIRFLNRKAGTTFLRKQREAAEGTAHNDRGDVEEEGEEEEEDSLLGANLSSTDLSSVLITRRPTIEWRLEQLSRQMIEVCNKFWELAGILPTCAVDPVVLTSSTNMCMRYLHPACRSLSQIAISVKAATMTDRDTNRAIKAGSKDARMDRATGVEVLDGFSFAGKKYHSQLVTNWLQLSGTDTDSVRFAFLNNFAAFCVLNYLFGFEATSGDEIMLSPTGEIFLKEYSTTFLGLARSAAIKDTPAARAARKASALTILPCFVMVVGMPGSEGFREFEVAFARAFKVLRQQGKLLSTLLTIGLSDLHLFQSKFDGFAAPSNGTLSSPTSTNTNFDLSESNIAERIGKFEELLLLEATEMEATAIVHKLVYTSLRLYLSV